MKYMGSKLRLAKYLIPIITKDLKESTYYIEPFVGGANMIDKIEHSNKIGSDINPFLIALLKEIRDDSVTKFPKNITKELYSSMRTKYNTKNYNIDEMAMIGYVGFCGSYGGKFYNGGYAGKLFDKITKKLKRDYPLEAYNNLLKQSPKLKGIDFLNCSYEELKIPDNSVIYCDIPYIGTTGYSKHLSKQFTHKDFYKWCLKIAKETNSIIYVSEYRIVDEYMEYFDKVFEKELKSSLNATKTKKSTEKLFKLNNLKVYNFKLDII